MAEFNEFCESMIKILEIFANFDANMHNGAKKLEHGQLKHSQTVHPMGQRTRICYPIIEATLSCLEHRFMKNV